MRTRITPVIRRCTAAALVVLVQLGATSAPLVHVHAGERDPDHHAQSPHAHFAPDPGTPLIDHGDEGRAMAAQVFVAVAVNPADAPAVAAAAFALVVPAERLIGRAVHVSHAHDPPAHVPVPSRAPPSAFLS